MTGRVIDMSTSRSKDITPETRISDLLKNYPELEETLIEMAPAFGKLRNPILRKTIAKVANLRQAAQIGDVPLAKLINTLRTTAGVGEISETEIDEAVKMNDKPAWVDKTKLKETFDARSLIESGGHPLTKVMEDLDKLSDDESYRLITPFLPAPLLDVAKSRGYYIWTESDGEDMFSTYFARMPD
ncbi:hypothetical protein CEE37_07515 [candidate division LCP-89 bacterium B3_LCP]|uniref:DUF1858 domain-containing protein n=1 Tax=candidate division LCP-89 bacterium B3_LCP TaxID=2012998 RepID=A0A532V0R2_UNCL8|nr:MAG: hypothetical protein CEE37_07515 [candidate division LCP-89 bacterium B3_LCP]